MSLPFPFVVASPNSHWRRSSDAACMPFPVDPVRSFTFRNPFASPDWKVLSQSVVFFTSRVAHFTCPSLRVTHFTCPSLHASLTSRVLRITSHSHLVTLLHFESLTSIQPAPITSAASPRFLTPTTNLTSSISCLDVQDDVKSRAED